jgi:hypothetical protein
MKISPQGDYYLWVCEWCDSENLTLWARFEKGDARCGACHKSFELPWEVKDSGWGFPQSAAVGTR